MTNINVPTTSEEIVSINPRMTLEEMNEVSKVFDVEPTIQEARIAREKRDMARFGRYGDENCEISPDERHLPNDIPSRGQLDQGRY